MNKFFSLLKVNLKIDNAVFFDAFRKKDNKKKKKKKKKNFFSKLSTPMKILLFILALTPLGIALGISSYQLMNTALALNMENLPVSMVCFSATVLCFIMSFIFLPSGFFFSSDLENYLALPISSKELIAVKMTTAIIEQYYTIIIFLLPSTIGMLIANFSISNLLTWLIILIVLPMLPTILAAIILLLVLQVLPFLRDKNKFTVLTGIISIILGFGLAIGMQFLNPATEPGQMEKILAGGDIFQPYYKIFPSLLGINRMLDGHVITGLMILIGVTALVFLLFLWIGDIVYLRIALSVSSASTKSKELNAEERSRTLKVRSSEFMLFLKRELITLVRTPAYFLNGFLPALITPLFLIFFVIAMSVSQGNALSEIMDVVTGFIDMIRTDTKLQITVGLIGGLAISMFGTSTSIVATAISRDAKHLSFFKSAPMNPFNYFMAKIFSGFVLNILTLLIYIAIFIYFTYDLPIFLVSMVISSLITGYTLNLTALWIDILRPSLNWTDETQAVKSNFNSGIGALISIGLFFALMILGLIFEPDLTIYTTSIFVAIALLGLIETFILKKSANKLMNGFEIA